MGTGLAGLRLRARRLVGRLVAGGNLVDRAVVGIGSRYGTRTLPAVVRVLVDEPERTVLEMTIREGKNREIRRMCQAVGLEVARLRRTALGAVKLGMLAPGQYRPLSKSEVESLRVAAARGKARSRQALAEAKAARRTALKK